METSPTDDEASAPKQRPPRKRAPKPTLDVSAEYRQYQIQSREPPQQLRSRLANEEKAADHERAKDRLILIFVLILLAVVAVYCLLLISLATSLEDRNWAKGVLGIIVSLGVGYVGGKSSRAA